MNIPEGKKIYFASDNHLGAPTRNESKEREEKFVKWLDTIKNDAAAIFLLGDLFDFGSNTKLLSRRDTFAHWESWQKFLI